jgi:hypothetical protein
MVLTLMNPNDNQIALSPTTLKGQGIKLEKCVCNKKVMFFFYLQYTVANNERYLYIRYLYIRYPN